MDSFEGDPFNALFKAKQLVLGPPALRQLADRKESLPDNIRPLYNLAMLGAVVCFTGFRNKEELVSVAEKICDSAGSIFTLVSARLIKRVNCYLTVF